MDFNKVKLVVSDMDGTLLNSKHQLSADFYQIFEKLKAKGIHFVAASGRQYYNLLEVFPDLHDDMYFIGDNGSYMVHKGQDLHVQAMAPEVVFEQIEIARKIKDSYPILCGKNYAYVDEEAPDFIKQMTQYYSRRKIVKNLLDVKDDDFLKIAICDFVGSEKNSYPHFKHLEGTLQVKVSGDRWLDLSHKEANKGVALGKLQKLLNIGYDETMVFGDFMNDIEMMALGKYSYAMENAHEEIKKIANYTTASNEEDGVGQILRQLV
ncbi:HAD family hydrolase [Fulvivirga sp.]|uniref:HAD family hydrolase n=1 Tax=Fulvivirga sp. TaxID=1931237 RepID=UPI0032F05A75